MKKCVGVLGVLVAVCLLALPTVRAGELIPEGDMEGTMTPFSHGELPAGWGSSGMTAGHSFTQVTYDVNSGNYSLECVWTTTGNSFVGPPATQWDWVKGRTYVFSMSYKVLEVNGGVLACGVRPPSDCGAYYVGTWLATSVMADWYTFQTQFTADCDGPPWESPVGVIRSSGTAAPGYIKVLVDDVSLYMLPVGTVVTVR